MDGTIQGVLSKSDVTHALGIEAFPADLTVADIMNPEPVSVPWTAPMPEAVSLMLDNDLSCLLVAMFDAPQGVLTQRDVLRLCETNWDLGAHQVRDAMSAPALTTSAKTSAWRAFLSMRKKGVRRLFVVNGKGFLAGVVTQTDILRFRLTKPKQQAK